MKTDTKIRIISAVVMIFIGLFMIEHSAIASNKHPLSAEQRQALDNFALIVPSARAVANMCLLENLIELNHKPMCIGYYTSSKVLLNRQLKIINAIDVKSRHYHIAHNMNWYGAFNAYDYLLATDKRLGK